MLNVLIKCLLIIQIVTVKVNSQQISLEIPHKIVGESVVSSATNYETKKYYFGTFFRANFFKANQFCAANNMRLLSVNDQDEDRILLNYMSGPNFPHKSIHQFWTSGTDLGDEGKFYFMSTGLSVGDLTFHKNEPNNLHKSPGKEPEAENCLALIYSEKLKAYKFSDKFCSSKFFFICEEIPSKTCEQSFNPDDIDEVWTRASP